MMQTKKEKSALTRAKRSLAIFWEAGHYVWLPWARKAFGLVYKVTPIHRCVYDHPRGPMTSSYYRDYVSSKELNSISLVLQYNPENEIYHRQRLKQTNKQTKKTPNYMSVEQIRKIVKSYFPLPRIIFNIFFKSLVNLWFHFSSFYNRNSTENW